MGKLTRVSEALKQTRGSGTTEMRRFEWCSDLDLGRRRFGCWNLERAAVRRTAAVTPRCGRWRAATCAG